MTDRRIPVTGSTVFVDDRGAEDAPALLYIHGGPGQSCYDFMSVQGDRLARQLRVVGVDQRGILRSDPVSEGQRLTPDLLERDFEEIREQLGIRSWTILAVSAGGGFGLDYAVGHPDRVHATIFDCPCWDADLTDRHRLKIVAALFEKYGDPGNAARCRALAETPRRLTMADDTRGVLHQLGPHYLETLFHDEAAADRFNRIWADSGFDIEDPQRSASHASVREDLYTARLGLLSRLRGPSLLLRGAYDLVTSPEMVDRFRADVAEGSVLTFEGSAHFPSQEEPDSYAEAVTGFVLAHDPLGVRR